MSIQSLLLAALAFQSIVLLLMVIIVLRLSGDISSSVNRSETLLDLLLQTVPDGLRKNTASNRAGS
jgi:hypothetical protein